MNSRRIRERVLCSLGVTACLAPAAFATVSNATTTTRAESPLERVYRLRFASAEPSEPGFPVATSADSLPSTAPVEAEVLRMDPAVAPIPRVSSGEAMRVTDSEIPDHPLLSDRFYFGIGVYHPNTVTEARLDSSSGLGTTVGFEDLLGLDDSGTSPQGIFRWRISERWRLELEYFELNRSNSLVTTQDITWGNNTFPAGSQINTHYNVAVTRVSTGYSFFKTQDKEIGVGLGFHVTEINAELSGSGGSGDAGKVLAPLPVLSLYGQVALTDTWAIATRLDAFRISYGPYDGHIYSIGLDALWQPMRHLGFGLGWRGLDMGVSASNSDWEGSVNTNFTGPIAFVLVSF